ncbi:MAG: methyltransferase domain-containing protein [Acidobacteriota bacterium]|nr:MAG: methyltransferase domain-containing protein [Acidobacteriota bacterium]
MKETLTVSQELVDRLAGGFRDAQVLLAATRLGVFDALEQGGQSADELAGQLDADPRGMRILCDALVGLGILERKDEQYRNGVPAKECLLSTSAHSKTAQMHHMARLYAKWGFLYDTVKTGSPVTDETIDPQLSPGRAAFARAMADSARVSADLTASSLDLANVGKMLDIGGGPGVFAIEFARRNPELEVTILDDEETLSVARQNIENAGLVGRIRTRPGNAFSDDLGSGYDFIFISNVIHIFSAAENADLVRRCAEALAPGGRLGIKDFFVDPQRSGPSWALLFAVNMLVNTERGDCYSRPEIISWFDAAGLRFREEIVITERSQLLVAER